MHDRRTPDQILGKGQVIPGVRSSSFELLVEATIVEAAETEAFSLLDPLKLEILPDPDAELTTCAAGAASKV